MLLEASGRCDEAAIARCAQEGGSGRVEGGPRRVVVCQASFGGEEIAPGTRPTLQQLIDESKRPPRLMDPVPPEIMSDTPGAVCVGQ